jgi:hypothetical protein
MTDAMTSQNIDLSSWDILYMAVYFFKLWRVHPLSEARRNNVDNAVRGNARALIFTMKPRCKT